MGVIEDKASLIAADMSTSESIKKYAFDPMTVITVVSVLVQVVELLYGCYKDHHQVSQVMQNPGLIERWRLRRVIKEQIGDDEAHAVLGNRMFKSMLNVSKSVTAEEAEAMHNEASH